MLAKTCMFMLNVRIQKLPLHDGPGQPPPRTSDEWLDRLRFDSYVSNTYCQSLDTTAAELKNLKKLIENLP